MGRAWGKISRTLKSGAYFGKDMIRSGGTLTPSAMMSGSILGLNALDSINYFGKPLLKSIGSSVLVLGKVVAMPIKGTYKLARLSSANRKKAKMRSNRSTGKRKGYNVDPASRSRNGNLNYDADGRRVPSKRKSKSKSKTHHTKNNQIPVNQEDLLNKNKKATVNNKATTNQKVDKTKEVKNPTVAPNKYQEFINNPNAGYDPQTNKFTDGKAINFTPDIVDGNSKLKEKRSVLDPMYSKSNQQVKAIADETASEKWLVDLKAQLVIYVDGYDKYEFIPESNKLRLHLKGAKNEHFTYIDVKEDGLYNPDGENYIPSPKSTNTTEVLTRLVNDYGANQHMPIFALLDNCIQNLGLTPSLIK